jgi:hypothetical protein
MNDPTHKGPPEKRIPAHPDWIYLMESGVIHPDLCFLASQAVGHLVMIASVPGGFLAEWHEWEPRNGKPTNHRTTGGSFYRWWFRREESVQATPERACIAYVNAYRDWLEDRRSSRRDPIVPERVTIATPTEIVSRFDTTDPREADRDAYLRGVEQAMALAAHLVRTARNHREAKWDLDLAERIAVELRRGRRSSSTHVLDNINAEVQSARAIRRKRA